MTIAKRIIARLDIKGTNLVKGVNLEGLRVLGKPDKFAKLYYEEGIDELIYQDVVASLYDKNCLNEIISKTAKEIFIPLTVGGGIRSLKDISSILRSGADKVSINTAAIKEPNLIRNASKIFGSSTITVSIEAIFTNNDYYAFTDNGRNNSHKKVLDWIKQVEDLGAGEIIVTFVDQEGTGKGVDQEFSKKLSQKVCLPVIIQGGFGKTKHIIDLLKNTKVSGVGIASMFHYDCINNNTFSYNSEDIGNVDFLKTKLKVSHIETTKIQKLKKLLKNNFIKCR